MTTLFLSLLLASAPCKDYPGLGTCSEHGSATINVTLTLESASRLTMQVDDVGVDAQEVSIAMLTTGEGAVNLTDHMLVLAGPWVDTPLMVTVTDGLVGYDIAYSAIAYRLEPSQHLTGAEVAMYTADFLRNFVALANK